MRRSILSKSLFVLASLVAGALSVAGPATAAPRGQVALTFDDLPALTQLSSQDYVDYANDMILRGLKAHRMPAIGFVNESKLDSLDRTRQIANLRKWRDAGLALGNHTFSHESPNDITAADYVADIARGEPVTRGLLAERHKTLTWFRHPYLETGRTREEKARIDDWLRDHHYRIAPVTAEASDWMFAAVYDDAIARRDAARVAEVRRQYLAYTDRMIGWYDRASEALVGRRFPLVLLLHVTRLNADSMDELAAILRRHGLKTVSLEAAMKDKAYEIRDPYVGPDGIEWHERWSRELRRSLPWGDFAEPPADIQADYKRIDNDH